MKNFISEFFTRCVYVLFISISIIACSTNKTPNTRPPGFLPNYSLLKPIPSPEGTQIYSYKDPKVNPASYTGVIVESVVLYESATQDGITKQQIESARLNITAGIKQIVSKRYKIVDKPGTGVAHLYVAITGAEIEGDSFKIYNLIPISAAIKLASMATGLDSKQPILVVEIKAVDSKTGKLLKETVSTIKGEDFRVGNTAEEFQKLAVKWVEQGLKYSSSKK